jgi:hypothetical protein
VLDDVVVPLKAVEHPRDGIWGLVLAVADYRTRAPRLVGTQLVIQLAQRSGNGIVRGMAGGYSSSAIGSARAAYRQARARHLHQTWAASAGLPRRRPRGARQAWRSCSG